MKLLGVIEVTSYEYTADELTEFTKIPSGREAIAIPLATADGSPNHLQIMVLDSGARLGSE